MDGDVHLVYALNQHEDLPMANQAELIYIKIYQGEIASLYGFSLEARVQMHSSKQHCNLISINLNENLRKAIPLLYHIGFCIVISWPLPPFLFPHVSPPFNQLTCVADFNPLQLLGKTINYLYISQKELL
jgi:hypothetical protein